MRDRGERLSDSLALAHGLLSASALANFDLDLPPADGGGSGFTPSTLAAMGTLYLQAELEQAGIIPAAEALADARSSLDLPSERVAERLERFANRQREWYDQANRNELFARVFGIGPGATNDGGSIVNREFEQRFAGLCAALDAYAAGLAHPGSTAARDEVRVRTAMSGLLANLELRRHGNTVFAARRVQIQLEASIEILKDPEVQAIFRTRGFWPTVARILAPNAPDFSRIIARGQAGQRLLGWIGGSLDRLGRGDGLALGPGAPVYAWAMQWLAASGLEAGAVDPYGGVR
jgi:hypothetical protein